MTSDPSAADPDAKNAAIPAGKADSAQPTKPTAAEAKAAVKAAGNDLPKAKALSLTQQVSIWILVLVVGVLFGMGTSFPLLMQGTSKVGGVDQNEISLRRTVIARLSEIQSGRRGNVDSDERIASVVRMARQADAEGLMPRGRALDEAVDAYIAVPIAGGRTLRDALVENQGGPYEVSRTELARFISERKAVEALQARHVAVPAIPLTVASQVASLREDKLSADEVVLDASSFLPVIADDDAELPAIYDNLRARRFTRPAAVVLTIVVADPAAFAAAETVSDDELAKRFESTKDLYKKPNPDPKAAAEYKPLSEVAGELKLAIQMEKAGKTASAKINAFNQQVEEFVADKDATRLIAAAKAAGLEVRENVLADEPVDGVITLGDLGSFKDLIQIHSNDKTPGFLSNPVPTDSATPRWLILRLESHRDAGFRPLAEVRAEVKEELAAKRAYAPFLAAAESARSAAEKVGLAAWVASPDAARWKTTVANVSLRATETLTPPPAERGGSAAEPRLAASLAATAVKPVVLVTVGDGLPGGATPKVKLVQAKDYTPAAAPAEADRTQSAEAYRNVLQGYRSSRYQLELSEKMNPR